MRLLQTFLLVALVALPLVMVHKSGVAYAQEDEVVETEQEEGVEEEVAVDGEEAVETDGDTPQDEEEEDDGRPKKHPDAETKILFVKPEDSKNLPAGTVVNVIVGFKNNGKQDFSVSSLDASFRYPQDFNYFIQNFTALNFGKVVEPNREASFEYSFVPSENFNGRPFGLNMNLAYEQDGKLYEDAVFNETVTITDPTEGFDAETFFMWITLAALVLLILVALQQTVFSSASRRLTSKSKVEMGTSRNGDIDYDWIPKETLNVQARRTSPRRRAGGKGGSGSSGEETN